MTTDQTLTLKVKEQKGDFAQDIQVSSSLTTLELKIMLETLSNIPAAEMRYNIMHTINFSEYLLVESF
jgi:uncharacterized membrane protein